MKESLGVSLPYKGKNTYVHNSFQILSSPLDWYFITWHMGRNVVSGFLQEFTEPDISLKPTFLSPTSLDLLIP